MPWTAPHLRVARPSAPSRGSKAPDYPTLADTLYRDLAAQLTSPGELALLAEMAERRGNHFLALKVGKIAAARGIDIGALTHPMGVIPDSADISGSGKALAYAIARQESEFNVGAVSSAGARGLLQLLPGTAKDVAKRAGIAYSPSRLVTDPGYNATLGAAFLGEQLEPVRGLLCADIRRLQCRAAPRAGAGSTAMATRAARISTRSSTGSSAFPTPRRAATCSA